jgi:hypothetical protein
MSFKLGHVSIPKRRIFFPLFLFCVYDSSVLQNFKIFTHVLSIFSYKDPRQTEVTYHCINFNDRVRKVPKIYYLNVWNVLRNFCNFDFFLILWFWNFMKFSNILISKKQFLCNKNHTALSCHIISFIDFARECNIIFYCTEILS